MTAKSLHGATRLDAVCGVQPVRKMLIEAVESHFGTVLAGLGESQFLSDDGSAYFTNETHVVARQLGLVLFHTPLYSLPIGWKGRDCRGKLFKVTIAPHT